LATADVITITALHYSKDVAASIAFESFSLFRHLTSPSICLQVNRTVKNVNKDGIILQCGIACIQVDFIMYFSRAHKMARALK